MALVLSRKAIAGSLIGGIAETQEMLDFCAEKGIVSTIELIPVQKNDEAYDRMRIAALLSVPLAARMKASSIVLRTYYVARAVFVRVSGSSPPVFCREETPHAPRLRWH